MEIKGVYIVTYSIPQTRRTTRKTLGSIRRWAQNGTRRQDSHQLNWTWLFNGAACIVALVDIFKLIVQPKFQKAPRSKGIVILVDNSLLVRGGWLVFFWFARVL